MKEKKKFNKKWLWLICAFVIVVLMLNAVMLYESRKVYQTQEIDMFIRVNNYTGFNVDTGALYFGTVPPSGKATRLLQISNGDKPSKLVLSANGDVAKWAILPNSTVSIHPWQTLELPISIIVPDDAPQGYYSGELNVRFIRD